ncbi:acyltransferase domain-containing protein [Antrihabitans cavernicola]|nr:acyltransferase domain-containing protein [Spelaeibacter cavernicola]
MGILYLLPGQGAQYRGMGVELYRTSTQFATAVDEVLDTLSRLSTYFPAVKQRWLDGEDDPADPSVTQPLLLAVEYGLHRLLSSWGIEPTAVLGHSAGELAAAVIADVLSLDDACLMLEARAAHSLECPAGGMLAVGATPETLHAILPPDTEIAGVNAPRQTMVSGPTESLRRARSILDENCVTYVDLASTRPFHHSLMSDKQDMVRMNATSLSFVPSPIEFVSGYAGTTIAATQYCRPEYWANHMAAPVRYWDAIRSALSNTLFDCVIEIGPGTTLSTIARRAARSSPGTHRPPLVLTSMSGPGSDTLEHLRTLRARADHRSAAEGVSA